MSKERLVELLKGDLPHFSNEVKFWHNEHIGELAEHLIANGVIVPNENEALLPVTEKELLHMLNDIIAYCQMLEERGCNLDNTFGYFSRRELYKKLGSFEREHFNRYTECPAREEAEKKLEET